MASVSRPRMVRDEYDEMSVKGVLGQNPIPLLPSNINVRRKILAGSTVCNHSTSSRTVTFYIVNTLDSETVDSLSAIQLKDLPLSSEETVEIPEWFLMPGWELWASASDNASVNCLISFKQESTS